MTALQIIIKKAKQLQKGNKKLTWKEAVKKSSAIYNRTKKPAAKKVVKKKAIGKKPAVKKEISKPGKHTDTKSHNVNIRVMSGTAGGENSMYKLRDRIEQSINYTLGLIELVKKKENYQSKKAHLKRLRSDLVIQKKQLREQNKLINQNLK